MTALVTKNLPLVAGAPDGIKKLRALILALAVRGRLVDQDPSEEPADEFLKQITVAKSQFYAGRSKRSLKETSLQSDPVVPFPPPAGWKWTTFGAATICRDGERVPVSQVDRELRAKEYDYYGASGVIDKIDGYLFDKPLLLIGEDGANLINRTTPIAFIARGRYWVNNHAHVIDGISETYLEYLALYINAIDLRPYVTGTAQPKMNQAKLNSIPVPLPPEPEQHRIVAKVDELMALCDRLEADQADADAAHAQLVQALLDSLTQASDSADFRASWQHLSEHFHTLFTTEASIDELMQAVLQLAVMGKLSKQDGADLPVPSQSNARTDDTRPRKSRVTYPPVGPDQQAFSAPNGWVWMRLGECAEQITDGEHLTPPRVQNPDAIPLVTAKNVRDGYMDYTSTDFVERSVADRCWQRCKPEVGDILMVSVGATLGRLTVLREAREMVIVRSVALIKPAVLTADFMALTLRSPLVQKAIWASVKQSAQPCLYLKPASLLPVPVPPLEEQHRIVAKVDELMALCDQLKAQLAEGRQQHAQLATVLVEQAVA